MRKLPCELFYVCVWATFGEIYKNIRIISVIYNKDTRHVLLKFYLDRIPTEYDEDAAREISCYIADDISTYKYLDHIEEELIFSDRPYRDINVEGDLIYQRREYDLEND